MKVTAEASAHVALKVTDAGSNVTSCDPVLTDLIRAGKQPATITATGIAQSEHFVHIYNGDPGPSPLILTVNGVKTQERNLEPTEPWTVDISSALQPDTVTMIARGKQRGQATILIADL